MYTSHNLDQELKDQKYREIICDSQIPRVFGIKGSGQSGQILKVVK